MVHAKREACGVAENGMHMADNDPSEWVIREVTYFDHPTHRFVVGDIEIDADRISAIKAAGTSLRAHGIDGRGYACTPGLVSAQTGALQEQAGLDALLPAGITTAARICASGRACVRAARGTRARLRLYLLLNGFARARTALRGEAAATVQPEVRAFERIETVVAANGGRLLPAVDCATILSAHELIYADRFAAAAQRRLAFVLSDCAPSARAFRERFYCSEAHLLAFLQLLQPGVTVWGTSQLTRRDVDILRAYGGVAASGSRERWPPPTRLALGAEKTSIPRSHSAIGEADTSGMGQRTFELAVGASNADALVDAATTHAATALGEPTCGRIAPGMRADLCLFSMTGASPRGAGSHAFVQLFERGGPDAVLVGGKLAYGAMPPSFDGATTTLHCFDSDAGRSDARLAASS